MEGIRIRKATPLQPSTDQGGMRSTTLKVFEGPTSLYFRALDSGQAKKMFNLFLISYALHFLRMPTDHVRPENSARSSLLILYRTLFEFFVDLSLYNCSAYGCSKGSP